MTKQAEQKDRAAGTGKMDSPGSVHSQLQGQQGKDISAILCVPEKYINAQGRASLLGAGCANTSKSSITLTFST